MGASDQSLDIVAQEQRRLLDVCRIIDRAAADRNATLVLHDVRARELEQERLDSVSWREKNDLTEKLIEHGHHDPRKYLKDFCDSAGSPYFGIIGIQDSNTRIGNKEYLIGKQSLMDGNRVAVVDWRKAEISRLYYDYEQGEDYLETIQGKDREGLLVRKDKVGITRQALHRIETPSDTFELVDDAWHCNGTAFQTSADTKSLAGDHRLVDIVALIDPEQFRMITRETDGCTYITGGAGCGKTTVALHRLSYLQFNQPKLFRPDCCLVLMFNRVLRDYVKKTSEELLGKTRVDTFSAWSLSALGQLGVYSLTTTFDDPHGARKKNSAIAELLGRYVQETRKIDPVMDLWRFFTCSYVLDLLFSDEKMREDFSLDIQQRLMDKNRVVSFSDVSILLRLCQLRKPVDAVVPGAFNHYDHIIVDEAQDLGALELEAVLAATSPRRSLTVCADERQKILSFVDGTGFVNFRRQLQLSGLDKETLAISYRSAREILELAARVSGRTVDTSKSHSGVVKFYPEKDSSSALRKVRWIVEQLVAREPNALTAIICKKKTDVKAIHRFLGGVAGLHGEGEVCFEPGVLVVNAHIVKGVEFTNVILWNPSETDYRQTEIDRNLLYVALTRASKRLYVVHWRPLAKGLTE
ncbi:MAG: ATP-binding domain-containing protein [Geobacteraceae bacterium]|nr:ATP-binding domain-containing protein [Geobacteraceae bacterium]